MSFRPPLPRPSTGAGPKPPLGAPKAGPFLSAKPGKPPAGPAPAKPGAPRKPC
jgi:hypothetical protein